MSNILTVNDLSVAFSGKEVVRHLSFHVPKGKTLAIVGESGSGKSVTSSAIMQLLPWLGGKITSGSIQFESQSGAIDIATATPEQMRHIRGKEIAMIFQESMISLDSVFTVGHKHYLM